MPISRRTLLKALGGGAALGAGPGPSARVRAQADALGPPALDAPLALGLLRTLADGPENLVLSPQSIAAALQLAWLGARGQTADEIKRALGPAAAAAGPPAGDDGGKPPAAADGQPPPRVRLADGVWIQDGIALAEPFRRAATERHRAIVGQVDFRDDPAGAVRTINDWVAAATERRVPRLFSEGGLDSTTRLVLTSAIYFLAPWATPFAERKTRPQGFRLPSGREARVPFMRAVERFSYAEDAAALYLRLPYAGGRYAMLLALPRADRPPLDVAPGLLALLARRDAAPRLEPQLVEVLLPRFQVRCRTELSDPLRALGVRAAFDPERADFGGMTAEPVRLSLAAVVHEAYLRVDEAGTEAAGATGMGFQITSAPSSHSLRRFCADHPFLLAIADAGTGRILFIGQVTDPTA